MREMGIEGLSGSGCQPHTPSCPLFSGKVTHENIAEVGDLAFNLASLTILGLWVNHVIM
jgi:hypothetical protein